jgi:ELWxxDGT repeat protein
MNNLRTFSTSKNQKLVAIDPRVPNYQQLIAGVVSDTTVIVLNENQDSIDQISHALRNCGSISSLHLLAHGAPGKLLLGNNPLQAEDLDRIAEKFKAWNQYLVQDAQILLYGCETGAGSIGRELVLRLSQLTNKLVAAASQAVGGFGIKRNWNLDVRNANFQLELAFQDEILNSYVGRLAEPYTVKNIKPSADSFSTTINNVYEGASLRNVLFFGAEDGQTGRELWKTDGTADGTVLVSDIVPGLKESNPKSFFSFKNNIYFAASNDQTGTELWKTDGENTSLVKDIKDGIISSNPIRYKQIGDKFFFRSDGGFDPGLYVSDGTADGTKRITDPSNAFGVLITSSDEQLTNINGRLLLVGNNII